MADSTYIGLREGRVYLALMAIYMLIYVTRDNGFGIDFINYYGNDLLFIPILMSSIKIAVRIFNIPIDIGKKEVLIAVIYTSVVFEWVLPSIGTNFVSDPIDVMAYTIGGLSYYLVIHRTQIDGEVEQLHKTNDLK
jgi:hypothetical protein